MVMFYRTWKLLNGQGIEDDQEKEILMKKMLQYIQSRPHITGKEI